jgi:hypothetical protein
METNTTTERIFPEVPDVKSSSFWDHMDHMVVLSKRMKTIEESSDPMPLKFLQKLPVFVGFLIDLLSIWFIPNKESGSFNNVDELKLLF